MCRAVILGLVLYNAVAAAPQTAPPTHPQTATPPYLEAINLYRRSEDELALSTLAGIGSSDLARERDALGAAFESTARDAAEWAGVTIRGAVMLHTAAAFSALERNNSGAFRFQFTFAQTYADKLASANRHAPFVRTWRLLVLALFQEARTLAAADQFSHRVRDPHGDSAELLLAFGATEEMAWWMRHEEDTDPGVKGDLKDAERHYRQALILAPNLTEARLRLGRVLALRDEAEGLKILGQIDRSVELAYQYLARLFEGDLVEKRGDTAEAERRYSAALSLIPSAQSANMALAHVRHARGARAEAAQDVRSSTGARDVADTADPWFWYSRGTAWRGAGYVAELRKMIAP
jgi:tetratricopeptide (TPR) repeat protein